jgi:hypothetical protein
MMLAESSKHRIVEMVDMVTYLASGPHLLMTVEVIGYCVGAMDGMG